MEGGFYLASKTIGLIARAEVWLLSAGLVGLVLLYRGRLRAGRRWLTGMFAALAALSLLPLGDLLLAPLEGRHPARPALERPIDGIIVLGGAEEIGAHLAWGGVQSDSAGERLDEAAALALAHPGARLIFTGGAATIFGQDHTGVPAAMARTLWTRLGVGPDRIVLEERSRNTSENAVFTRDMIRPAEGQAWVLVTSAFHMPRSVETFERAGWTGLIPWPVDHQSGRLSLDGITLRLDDHLSGLNKALKEYLGLVVYRVLER